MRNDLLEQLVIASGGTVTNKSDRNALLSDWLTAVSTAYVARLDGAIQYWQLTEPFHIPAGGSIELDFYAYSVDWQTVISGFSATSIGRIGELRQNGANDSADIIGVVGGLKMYLDNQLVESTVTEFPVMTLSKLRIDIGVEPVSYRYICARDNGNSASSLMNGYVKNIRAYDASKTLTNEIQLTNKSQGATQIATVGNVNATMINYTEDVWEKI